ncbi:hypothetical protein INS49_007274 [Diaporthe citri]|uniref:uncharacterized protein n=1 Tax=Diaporthe citri TaxID=83186 RepID=UPI001C7E810F|nr:uncharacterized protein INS49_007274 [Diaporthe citri]KAG6365663.1 hypothetical protein INS49_007274 [Diaporthe citri]
MKTDFLRYLVILAEGGVYSDLDTWALKPVDDWVPQYLRGSVRAVVGIEFDQLDGDFPPGFGDGPSYSANGHSPRYLDTQSTAPWSSLAISGNSPTTNPVAISATQGRTFNPEAIFIGTFVKNGFTGAAALTSASTVTVTATFKDATTAQTTFNFDPPNTVFGVAINAEAMQYFQFPCEWSKVVSLSFVPQAENGVNVVLGLAIDNFQYIDDTSA